MFRSKMPYLVLALALILPSAPIAAETPARDRAEAIAEAAELDEAGFQLYETGDYARALPLFAEVYRLRREVLGEQHYFTLISLNNYVAALQGLGRANEAEPLAAEALRISREVLGERHSDTLASLNSYVILLLDLGRANEAEPLSAEALRISREVLGERHPSSLSSLSVYGVVLMSLGRGDDALPVLAEALRLSREILGERHPDTLLNLINHAVLLTDLGLFDEAEPPSEEALRLSREVLGERHPNTLTSLGNYAFVLQALGRSAEAEPLSAEALRLRRETLGERHPDTLLNLNNYANLLLDLGLYDEAEPLSKEALSLSRELLGERHPNTLIGLNTYAAVLLALGRAKDAEPLYAGALRLSREALGERHPESLKALNNYAAVLDSLGRANKAAPLYAEALRLSRELLGERHPDTLNSLSNYAFVLQTLGRSVEAEPLSAEALRLSREVLGERHPDTLISLNNYAVVLDRLGRANEAEPLYAEALRLSRKLLGERHPDTLNSLSNYAFVLQALGRSAEAEPLSAEALRLRRETLGERHPDTLVSLNNYALLLELLGRLTEAESLLSEALDRNREALSDRHPRTLNTLVNYAEILLDSARAQSALPLFREWIEVVRSRAIDLSEDGLRGGAQRDRELQDRQFGERRFANALWANFAPARTAQAGLPSEAFTALQLSSAGSTSRAVAEAAAARFASEAGMQASVQERQVLARRWAIIEAAMVESQVGGGEAAAVRRTLRFELAAVEVRIGEIDAQLEVEAPQYFAILNQQAVELEQLRTVLGEDEAILLLVPTALGTHSMAITRKTVRWERADIDRNALSDVVDEFRLGLEIQAGDAFLPVFDLELAHELYADLIAPVEDALEGKSRVYVVADGALSRLPLGTLITSPVLDGADGDDPEVLRSADWLADRFALVQLPSLQSLVYIRSFGIDGEDDGVAGFAGFGAPVLEGAARLRGARSATLDAVDAASLISELRGSSGMPLMSPDALRRLAALPGTQSELEQVRGALGAPQEALFLAERMTEPSIRSADLSKTRILHLATHGFTSEESGETAEPGLVFTPPTEAKPEDDGYLAASEVVGLNLTQAEWVILSACNTASPSGKPGETGLSGLAQAFFYAGAESLLVSHWPVFDDIAPLLTVEALKRSRAGQPRAEALQAAMQAIRNDPELDAAHPAVWAPFTLVGEGR